jgi:hypothetical protein
MRAQRKYRRGDLIPVIVAAILAVVGQTVILFNDFGAGNDSQGRGNARMITAAVVSRAGAIEIPSESPAGRPVSWAARTATVSVRQRVVSSPAVSSSASRAA